MRSRAVDVLSGPHRPFQALRALAWLCAAGGLLALGGCGSLIPLPKVDVIETTASLPLGAEGQPVPMPGQAARPASPQLGAAGWPYGVPAPVPPPSANGAIFRSETFRPLFEGHRARLVGDTITIQISEKLSAAQSSTSNIARNGTVSAGITALPFLKASALTRAGADGNSANTFAGEGKTEASNDFSGTITATVVHVLPNGHLVVAAEKQIGVNANVDVLRFSGQVDPRSIAPTNSVQSTQVANVRIEQRARGQAADAQSMGWLSRVFMNVLPM